MRIDDLKGNVQDLAIHFSNVYDFLELHVMLTAPVDEDILERWEVSEDDYYHAVLAAYLDK